MGFHGPVLYRSHAIPFRLPFEPKVGYSYSWRALLYPVLRRSASRLTRPGHLSAVIECIADGSLLGRTGPSCAIPRRCARSVARAGGLVGMDADESRALPAFAPGAPGPPNQFVSSVRSRRRSNPSQGHPAPPARRVIIDSTAAAVRCGVTRQQIVVSVHDITETERLETSATSSSRRPPTPSSLAIIKASAQMLLSGGLAPRPARSAAAIERQSQQVDRLVETSSCLPVFARGRCALSGRVEPPSSRTPPRMSDYAEHEVYRRSYPASSRRPGRLAWFATDRRGCRSSGPYPDRRDAR